MTSGGKNLTEGPLARQILVFSLPLVLSNLLQAVFNMTDIAVVGRFAGSQALGSVGSTTIFVTLMTGFLIGLGGGVNVLVARFYGAEQPKDVEKSVHSALLVCLAAGVLLLAVGVAFSPALMRLLGTKPDLIDGAILYLRIYFLGMPAMAIYNFGNGVFSAVGDTRKPLVYLTIAGVLNVILDLFFVIVCKMSVAGAALATILTQYLSAFLILRALAHTEGCYGLRREKLHLDPVMTRSILGLGVPAGCQNAIFALANLFIQASINTFDTVVVSGNAAAANADPLVYDVMAAFYTACASFMLRDRGGAGAVPGAVRPDVPVAVHHRAGRGRGGDAAVAGDGAVLSHLGLYGLHHRGFPRPGPHHRAHLHRHHGFLRVPGGVGVHGVRLLRDPAVPVPAVRLLLDHHGHCRGDLFRPRLQRADAHLRKGINTLDIAFWGAWKGRPFLFWLDIWGPAVYDSKVNSEGEKLWKEI